MNIRGVCSFGKFKQRPYRPSLPSYRAPAAPNAPRRVFTKADIMNDFESFHDKLESFENGAIDVQVFGNVAVANGSVSEKRSRGGKDVSGEFLWTDLLEKRAGKWQVVRSAGYRIR